jgi:predicted branched-subunit amino acid permease
MLETRESQTFGQGLKSALPIAIGYIPVAITFGILGKTGGVALAPVAAMSLFVFAGAAQFMALSLMVSGVAAGQIVLAVFLLNLRHLLFTANLSRKLPRLSGPASALVAFGVTDEVFSVASAETELRPRYLLGLELGAWSAWCGGTILGYLAGNLLPAELAAAFGTGLFALFASLAVWQVRSGGGRVLLVVLLAGGLNTVFRLLLGLAAGWAFVIAMMCAAVAGLILEEVHRG